MNWVTVDTEAIFQEPVDDVPLPPTQPRGQIAAHCGKAAISVIMREDIDEMDMYDMASTGRLAASVGEQGGSRIKDGRDENRKSCSLS